MAADKVQGLSHDDKMLTTCVCLESQLKRNTAPPLLKAKGEAGAGHSGQKNSSLADSFSHRDKLHDSYDYSTGVRGVSDD